MTVLAHREESIPTEEVPAVDATLPPPRTRPPVRRLVVAGVAGLAVVVLAALLMELALGQVWYESRQRHLVSDFAVKRTTARKGQALAILQVPRINMNLVVVEGDGPAELRAGPGHRPRTPPPGGLGNSLIFGHRANWGGPFASLSKLKLGDNIVAEGRDRTVVVFQVVSVKRVQQDNVSLLAPSNDYRMTLVTSTGGRLSSDRLVVSAVSGTLGELSKPGKHPAATAGNESVLINPALVVVLLAAVAIFGTIRVLRGRYRPWIVAVVVAPLALAGLLGLFLDLDLLLPRLA